MPTQANTRKARKARKERNGSECGWQAGGGGLAGGVADVGGGQQGQLGKQEQLTWQVLPQPQLHPAGCALLQLF